MASAVNVEAIDRLLPQTQCTRCGHPGCRPYAEAIARGEEDINRCPPGGERTIAALARLLGRAPRPLDPQVGPPTPRQVAVIDESRCIGCARCLPACPVDAIVGAKRFMHTVIAGQCTGCELCLPPCPVDCIELRPLPAEPLGEAESDALAERRAAQARQRFERHNYRLSAAAHAEREAFEAARRHAREVGNAARGTER
ncbi:MAG TPA: RnfABCDGE type electron transport complex subunit B [Steroidobacteraceae bacterium]|nr:RnfABCDGE type electron transport complex subunit B [Steroidobacteraceae bacterium]